MSSKGLKILNDCGCTKAVDGLYYYSYYVVPNGAFADTDPPAITYLWWSYKYPLLWSGSNTYLPPAWWFLV